MKNTITTKNLKSFKQAQAKAVNALINNTAENVYLSAKDLANIAGVTTQSVYGRRRELPQVKILGRRLFNPAAAVHMVRKTGTHKTLGVHVSHNKVKQARAQLTAILNTL